MSNTIPSRSNTPSIYNTTTPIASCDTTTDNLVAKASTIRKIPAKTDTAKCNYRCMEQYKISRPTSIAQTQVQSLESLKNIQNKHVLVAITNGEINEIDSHGNKLPTTVIKLRESMNEVIKNNPEKVDRLRKLVANNDITQLFHDTINKYTIFHEFFLSNDDANNQIKYRDGALLLSTELITKYYEYYMSFCDLFILKYLGATYNDCKNQVYNAFANAICKIYSTFIEESLTTTDSYKCNLQCSFSFISSNLKSFLDKKNLNLYDFIELHTSYMHLLTIVSYLNSKELYTELQQFLNYTFTPENISLIERSLNKYIKHGYNKNKSDYLKYNIYSILTCLNMCILVGDKKNSEFILTKISDLTEYKKEPNLTYCGKYYVIKEIAANMQYLVFVINIIKNEQIRQQVSPDAIRDNFIKNILLEDIQKIAKLSNSLHVLLMLDKYKNNFYKEVTDNENIYNKLFNLVNVTHIQETKKEIAWLNILIEYMEIIMRHSKAIDIEKLKHHLSFEWFKPLLEVDVIAKTQSFINQFIDNKQITTEDINDLHTQLKNSLENLNWAVEFSKKTMILRYNSLITVSFDELNKEIATKTSTAQQATPIVTTKPKTKPKTKKSTDKRPQQTKPDQQLLGDINISMLQGMKPAKVNNLLKEYQKTAKTIANTDQVINNLAKEQLACGDNDMKKISSVSSYYAQINVCLIQIEQLAEDYVINNYNNIVESTDEKLQNTTNPPAESIKKLVDLFPQFKNNYILLERYVDKIEEILEEVNKVNPNIKHIAFLSGHPQNIIQQLEDVYTNIKTKLASIEQTVGKIVKLNKHKSKPFNKLDKDNKTMLTDWSKQQSGLQQALDSHMIKLRQYKNEGTQL